MKSVGHHKVTQHVPKAPPTMKHSTQVGSYKMDRPRTNKVQANFAIQAVRPQQYPDIKTVGTPELRPRSPKQLYQVTASDYVAARAPHLPSKVGTLHSKPQSAHSQHGRIPQHSSEGGSFKMNGIRVVKQPNSNLTYLQSYPAHLLQQQFRNEYL